jgi:iron(III) transport system substrate-binding protein
MRRLAPLLPVTMLAAAALAGCGGDDGETLTIYSGRTEELVQPLLEQFSDETGIDIRVRYGETAELAATILEEGDNAPADIFFAQDAGALGAIDADGRLMPLDRALLDRVPAGFRADDGDWVGISGRARVVVYNTDRLGEDELPDSIDAFTADEWRGRIGWVPSNGSFQSFVTAYRLLKGEGAARAWLEGIKANDPEEFSSNPAAVEAVARGDVDVAFVNHYYLFRFLAEQGEGFAARNHFLGEGDPGALINVAGAGIIAGSDSVEAARRFLEFMLSEQAQRYFADETYEYPLAAGVEADEQLPPLSELQPPQIDLSALSDLQGTTDLMRETEVLD